MRSHRLVVGLFLVVTVATVGWVVIDRGPAANATNPLAAVRITPSVNADGDVEGASLEQIEFKFQVYNHSRRVISGLKLGLGCGCEATDPIPNQILPGTSIPVGFRLRAPVVGVVQRRIPLTIEGQSEPALVLETKLRAKLNPPVLIPADATLNLTFVQGDAGVRELAFYTIEQRQDPAWIEGIEFEPPGVLKVQSSRVDELREPDPQLVRRHYHFQLGCEARDTGHQQVAVTFQTGLNKPAELPSPLVVNVVDPVAIVPNPLVIRGGQQLASRRVHDIFRAADGVATVRKFDDRLLDVQPLAESQGRRIGFDVSPINDSTGPVTTRVEFQIADGQTRELVVRLEPSESSGTQQNE